MVKTPPFHGGNMGSSPVRVTKNKQLTEGGLLVFDNSRLPRDSKGAEVNGVPGARQSRAPARPQAGSPVRVTKNKQLTEGGLLVFDNSRLPRDSKGAGVNDMPVACQSRAPARPRAGSPVRVTKKGTPHLVVGSSFLIIKRESPDRALSLFCCPLGRHMV